VAVHPAVPGMAMMATATHRSRAAAPSRREGFRVMSGLRCHAWAGARKLWG
jgi:hypothetical protein